MTLDPHIAVAHCWRYYTDACSDGASIHPVLKAWLLCAWHRLWNIVHWMHQCFSWRRQFIRCFTSFFTWSPEVLSLAPMSGRRIFRQPLDAPMLRYRFFRCYWFLQNSSNSTLLWVLSSCFVLYGLFISSMGFRNVHSTKLLVPLIVLSYDH